MFHEYRYQDAARLNRELENYPDALRCAGKGIQLDEDCLGTDHPVYQQGLHDAQELRRLSDLQRSGLLEPKPKKTIEMPKDELVAHGLSTYSSDGSVEFH